MNKIIRLAGFLLLGISVGIIALNFYNDSQQTKNIAEMNKQEVVVDYLTEGEKKVVKEAESKPDNSPLPTVIDKDNRGLVVGKLSIPSISLNVPIFKGEFSDLGDNMLYGAVTNKENQEMGRRNYVLSSHVVNNPNNLFTSLHKVKIGESVFLKDDKYIYEYKIIESKVVKPRDIGILDDVPDKALLTLYTCKYINEFNSNGTQKTDRTVKIGEFVSKEEITEELNNKYFNF